MSRAYVTATIEHSDGTVRYRTFTAVCTIARLKGRIRRQLARDTTVVHVGLGNGYYVNSYGAH